MRRIYITAILMIAVLAGKAQCDLYDFYGNPSGNPVWYHCNGTNYTLNLQSPYDLGTWTVDWGDGSPNTSGPSLVPPQSISHVYSATVDTYTLIFTETSTGCTVNGTVILEEATSASIQIPVGGLTQACAPQAMEFTNSSTNVSENTIFEWDFGDGSPNEVYDYTNWNQTISHTYQQNTVDCETVVTLIAQNQCNIVQGGSSTATFNPIRIWDYDDAAITPSEYVLCWPDNTVDYENTSDMNCYMQGNIAQRYEYWNFGDYWGLGYDSIMDWTPWPPTFPQTISYPAMGDYSVMLLDSNFCGIDTAYVTISIVPPPTAGVSVSVDTICQGQSATFYNNSSAEANAWLINYGDGGGWQSMGPTSSTHTFNNQGNYSIGLVAYVSGAGASCIDTAWVDLFVRPSPIADFSLSDYEACDFLTYSVTESSTNAVLWNWDMGNGNTYTLQNPPDQAYAITGNYTVSLQVESINGCTNSTSQEVDVYESPVAEFTTADLCLGDTAVFSDASTFNSGDPIISYTWNFGDATAATGPTVDHYYASGGLYNVLLTTTTANCTDDTLVQVNVDTPPTVAFGQDIISGCSPLEVQFTDASSGAVVYNWDFGDGTSSSTTSPFHIFNNPSTSDTVYTVVLSGENAFGCGATATVDISVFGTTSASFTSNATPGCAPYEADFTNTSSGAIGYEWDFGDGTPISTVVHPTHLFENNTEFIQYYTVELIAFDSNGCNDTTTQTVISYPEPDFSFDISGSSGCAPLLVQMPAVSGAVSYAWDFGDGNTASGPSPSHVFQNTGAAPVTYTVQLIASNPFGCVDTAYSDIDVYPIPQSLFVPDPSVGCSPLTINFDDQSSLSVSNRWIFAPGDTLIVPPGDISYPYVNTSATPINYNVRLRVTSAYGCARTSSQMVTINPEVSADFTSETIGCSPLTVDFENNSVGGTEYEWQFGDGGVSVAEDPQHVYNNSTGVTQVYQVRLVTLNDYNCSDTVYSDITVYPEALAQFSANPLSGCSPLTVSFENSSLLADQNQWIFAPGDTLSDNASTIEHVFTNSGSGAISVPVELIVTTTEGCSDNVTHTVTVYPDIAASFTSVEEGCSPLVVSFTNTSQGATSYAWNFGDGYFSSGESPDHTYVNNSASIVVNQVELVATNIYGCTDTASTDISVYPKPIAQFVPSALSGCSPLTVQFDNISYLADESVWVFGILDTLIDNSSAIEYTFVNSGTSPLSVPVQLTVTTTEGCTEVVTQTITVYPSVSASFNSIEEGCSPLEVIFENTSEGATTYSWNFGDGSYSASESPTHTYINNSATTIVNQVEMVASNSYGCSAMATTDISVYPRPIAQFVPSTIAGCSPLTVRLDNTSYLANESLWIYGNGDSLLSNVISHEVIYENPFLSPVSYTTVLEITSVDGCESSYSQVIQVYPEVHADFSMESEGCAPLQVDFENNTIGATTYAWSFGDGLLDNQSDPSHLYGNTTLADIEFIVELTANSSYGCMDNHIDTVLVFANPKADFNISVLQGCTPLDVQISDNSSIADSYTWTYGDGQTSNLDESHMHTFINQTNNPVDFDIVLEVQTANGCSDTQTMELTVYPAVSAYFETDEALCSDALFTFFNQTQGAMSYQWEFGDGESSISNNPLHSYTNTSGADQTYDVLLTATSQYQCTDQHTETLTVYTSPIADISIDSSSVCYPLYIEFGNQSQYATEYSWDYGDGNLSDTDAAVHSHVFTNTTSSLITYEIEMIATSAQGCTDVTTTEVQVIPELVVDFEFVEDGCHPLLVEFNNESEGALAYDWYLEENENSTEENPVYVFNNYGIQDEIFEVVLVASSYFGCSDTVTQSFTVFPLPDAEFGVDPNLQVFPESTVQIFDYSVSGASAVYSWDLGDGTLSSDPDLAGHTYGTWGSYDISLIIDNGHCSDQSIQNVEIMAPPPIAAFDGSGDGCAPVTIAFENLSLYGTNYLWNFGDGGVSSNEEPVYTYYIPGTYTVSLLVTGPGGSEIVVHEMVVHVYPNAQAYYTANPDVVNTGDVVFFYNLSIQADQYTWDFGDGQTSNESNPTHIYQETGYYDVALIANNQYNCPDTFLLDDAVFVDVGGYIDFPNAFTPDPLGSSDGRYDPNQLDNDIFYPIYAGVEDYKLQIYNRWGELLYQTNEIGRGWDGFYKGQLAQQGVYVWRAEVTFTDGKQFVKAGDLTLLR